MVEDKVLQLNDMSVNELKDLWRQYFDSEPIWKTKRYYIPRLAYRMQELVYGGVPENIKNILLGKTIRREFSDEHIDGLPKVGTRLVKMYRGIHGLRKVSTNGLNVGVDANHFRPISEDDVLFFKNAILNHYDYEVFYDNR